MERQDQIRKSVNSYRYESLGDDNKNQLFIESRER